MTDDITVAPGVTRSDNNCWGYILEGSKEALINSGLVLEAWFVEPGKKNKRGYMMRSKRQTVDGRRITTTVQTHGSCVARFRYTGAEAEAAKRREDAAERLALMQPDALRKHVEDKFLMRGMCFVFGAFNLANSPDEEWTFPSEVQDRATELCKEIIWLFRDSPIRPKVGAAVEGDAQFQRFMQSAMVRPLAPNVLPFPQRPSRPDA